MVLPEIDEDKISEEYDELFEKFWSQITNEMRSLQDRMRENRDLEDTNLKLQIDKVLQDCRQNSNLPSVEEINKLRNEKDSYNSAYSQYTVELRAGLSRRFLDIDEGLKQTIEEVKSQVVRVLIDKCHLGGLSEAKNSAFLAEVTTQIPAKHDELKKGFDILAEFNLSYRGLIQHRIRSQLDNLVPDKTAGLPSGANSKVVLETLTELYKETIDKCEDALDGFLKEPSQASFAIVEEFIDRILRAKSSQKEWRQFLRKKRSQIWPNFGQLQTQVDAHKTWLSYLDAVDNQVKILENSLKQL